MPVIVALLAINLSLGVMARAAPQLNIFAVGFPVMIVLGMGLVLVTLPNLPGAVTELCDQSFVIVRDMLGER